MKWKILLFVYAFSVTDFCGESTWAASDADQLSAKQLLHQAIELGANLEPPGRQIDLYKAVANEFAARGATHDATTLAQYFDVKRERDDVLQEAVHGSLRKLREAQALELADLITEEFPHDLALTDISRFQADKGAFSSALKTISRLRSSTMAQYVLADIAPLMMASGNTEDVLRAAVALEFAHSKTWVLSSILKAQYKRGDEEGARETANTYSERQDEQWPIVALANAQAEMGRFHASRGTASALKDPDRFYVLSHLAEALAKAGDVTEALSTAKSIPFPLGSVEDAPSLRHRTLGAIAVILAENGDYAGAFSTIILIPSDMPACDICEGLRDDVTMQIGRAQARRGDIDLALETSRKLHKTGYYGDEVLKEIVLAQLKQGKIEAALKTSKRFKSNDHKAKIYLDVAQDWVHRDGSARVMRWVSRLSSKLQKAYALVGIASAVTNYDLPADFSSSHTLKDWRVGCGQHDLLVEQAPASMHK